MIRQLRGAVSTHANWPIFAGLLIGIIVIPYLHAEYTKFIERREIEHSKSLPVVSTTAKIIARTNSYVDMHLTGSKHRDCQLVDVTGWRVRGSPPSSDIADVERVDRVSLRATRPVGQWDGGIWRLQIGFGESGWIQSRHDCDGVVVTTMLGRVDVGEGPP